jgi:hypothetical protein
MTTASNSDPKKIENVAQPGSVQEGPKSFKEAWAKAAGVLS